MMENAWVSIITKKSNYFLSSLYFCLFQSLLAMPSIREKESKKVGEEILDLLSKPTAKERSLAERFRSNGAQVQFLFLFIAI